MADKENKDIAMVFADESTSAARNKLYAARFKKKGKHFLAKLLNAISESEEVHARRAFMHLRGKIGDPDEYFNTLKKTKYEAFATVFPSTSSMLYRNGKKTTAEAFEQFGEVSKNHYDLMSTVSGEVAGDSTTYWVCQVCGYIAVDDAPGKCPVCGAITTKFNLVG